MKTCLPSFCLPGIALLAVLGMQPPLTVCAQNAASPQPSLCITGYARAEFFTNIATGGSIAVLTADDKYVNNQPDEVRLNPAVVGVDTYGENYGTRITALFIPATTGNYVFYTASDDMSELYLSTDEDPAHLALIASEPEWNNPRSWTTVERRDPTNPQNRSDRFQGTGWPGGNTISLEAGQRYYLQVLHAEGTSGDGVGVNYKLEGEPDPADGTDTLLRGDLICALVDPASISASIAQQPQPILAEQGREVVFTVGLATTPIGLPAAFQWQENEVDIPGATNGSYSFVAGTNDSGMQYRVLINVTGGISLTSDAAQLTVVNETSKPVVISVGALKKGDNQEIGVVFSEAVEATSATTLANYTLDTGTIMAARYVPKDNAVILTASGLTGGESYNLSVSGVRDPAGNSSDSVTRSFKAQANITWAPIGANEGGYIEEAIAVSENGFDIISGGVQFWAAYDELTFVYEPVTGNFDKAVQIEFVEPASNWARSGIQVREAVETGVARGGTFSRYFTAHSNPEIKFDELPGNDMWESNFRTITGGDVGAAGGGNVTASTPLDVHYPHVWARLRREGNVITSYRSTNGLDWVQHHMLEYADPVLNDTLFVGPFYSPENGNIGPLESRGSWLAKFRNYSDFTGGCGRLIVTALIFNEVSITWEDLTCTLQGGPTINGPWTDIDNSGAYIFSAEAEGPQRFYRLFKP